MPKAKKKPKKAAKPRAQIPMETVRRVARIARIDLTEEEVEMFQQDLNDILESFKILDKAKVSGVDPSFQPLPVKDVLREDEIETYLGREKALENTKHKQEGQFKGPKVIE